VPREGIVEEDVPLDGDGGVGVEGEASGEVDGYGCACGGEGDYDFVDRVGCALFERELGELVSGLESGGQTKQ
jgi:hypothetical protein